MFIQTSWFEKLHCLQHEERQKIRQIRFLGRKGEENYDQLFSDWNFQDYIPHEWFDDESLIRPVRENGEDEILSPEQQQELEQLQRERKEIHEQILEIQRQHSKELEQFENLMIAMDEKEKRRRQLLLKAPEIENECGKMCRNMSALTPEDKQEWDRLQIELNEIRQQLFKIGNS